jgi:hypothetical protein
MSTNSTNTSGSASQTVTVCTQVSSTTTLSAQPLAPVVGQPVTYTATVSSNGRAAPTGTVTFASPYATLCFEEVDIEQNSGVRPRD